MNFYNRFYFYYKLTLVFLVCLPLLPSFYFLRKYKVCLTIFRNPKHIIVIFFFIALVRGRGGLKC